MVQVSVVHNSSVGGFLSGRSGPDVGIPDLEDLGKGFDYDRPSGAGRCRRQQRRVWFRGNICIGGNRRAE